VAREAKRLDRQRLHVAEILAGGLGHDFGELELRRVIALRRARIELGEHFLLPCVRNAEHGVARLERNSRDVPAVLQRQIAGDLRRDVLAHADGAVRAALGDGLLQFAAELLLEAAGDGAALLRHPRDILGRGGHGDERCGDRRGDECGSHVRLLERLIGHGARSRGL
jgi:hypothetical protein